MRYDLTLINDLCQDLGMKARVLNHEIEITLGDEVVLLFQNAKEEDDCLIGFVGTPWHGHGDLTFVDGRGFYIELNSLDIISGLKDGNLLVGERWAGGKICDRWLIHQEYNDEFKYMDMGEEIRIRRLQT